MILVRTLGETLYFLLGEKEEETCFARLAETYPGRALEVVERRAGLLIARVGGRPAQEGERLSSTGSALTIVGLPLRSVRRAPRAEAAS